MTTVQHLLSQKGHGFFSAGPDDTVADEDVGSLVVMEHGKLIGIITERHYSRNVFLKGRSSPQTKVAKIMERDVVCVRPSSIGGANVASLRKFVWVTASSDFDCESNVWSKATVVARLSQNRRQNMSIRC